MALTLANAGDTVQPAVINQFINVLQQPSGGQEAGHYYLAMAGYTTNATVSEYVMSLSRTSVPVSVSIDSADQAANGLSGATPSTDHLTMGGFHVFNHTNAAHTDPNQGGNYTIQF